MRATATNVCLFALALALLAAGLLAGGQATQQQHQQSADGAGAAAASAGEHDFASSSLAAGVVPFDVPSQWAYAESLPAEVRDEALIRLNSRFVLADAEIPLPEDPHGPFWLRLRGEMSAAFRDTLVVGHGATLLGYSNRHVYLVRAGGADAALKRWLKQEPLVVGTQPLTPNDRTEATVWRDLVAPGEPEWSTVNVRLVFFPDTPVVEAEALLAEVALHENFALRSEDDQRRLRLGEFPMVHVTLNPAGLDAARHSPWIEMIEYEPVPELLNQDSVTLANAVPVYNPPYNLSGAGQLIAIWDGGFAEFNNQHHPDYADRVISAEGPIGSTGGRRHAIHVMGTILGSGANDGQTHSGTGQPHARGYAPNAEGLVWDFFGTIELQRQQSRHEYFHIADNHSWTYTIGQFGSYSSYARATDEQNRDLLLSYIKSAGNDGSGDMTVRGDKGNKNGLTVAAVTTGGNVASFSSRGPMLDGRLHPFISNNGVQLRSCDWNSGWTYRSASGTSMSAPSTTGSITLLSEHWGNLHDGMPLQPDVVMAVLANTAQDVGNPGPDYVYGHGIVDVQAAADLMMADANTGGSHIVRGHYEQGTQREYRMHVESSAEPLQVTLHWHDDTNLLAGTVVLVNDLDLELEDPAGNIHYPYRGLTSAGSQTYQFTTDGPNRRDNTITVSVANPTPGDWTVRVRAATVPWPETRYGYVLASQHALDRTMFRSGASIPQPVPIPADNPDGLVHQVTVPHDVPLDQVRAYVYANHPDRRHLRVTLTHPSGTVLELARPERVAPDLIAVFPDTKSTLDDVAALNGLSAKGTWTLRVADLEPGSQGTLHYLGLEFDLVNLPPLVQVEGGGRYEIAEPVALDASESSDPNGHTLTFQWNQYSGIPVTLANADTAVASFTTPSVTQKEDLVFEVLVTDGEYEIPALVTVTVLPPNNPPVAAVVAETLATNPGGTVILDASASTDPDQDPLSYTWTQLDGPTPQEFRRANEVRATVVAGAQTGTMLFEVLVEDGRGGADTAEVTVFIHAPVSDDACGTLPARATAQFAGLALLAVLLLLLRARRQRPAQAPAKR